MDIANATDAASPNRRQIPANFGWSLALRPVRFRSASVITFISGHPRDPLRKGCRGQFIYREPFDWEPRTFPPCAIGWKRCTHVLAVNIGRSRTVKILFNDEQDEIGRPDRALRLAWHAGGHQSFPWYSDTWRAVERALFNISVGIGGGDCDAQQQ